jgi:hypothetical protein
LTDAAPTVDARLTEILAEVGTAVADMVAERESIAEQLTEMNTALADMVAAVESPSLATQLDAISAALTDMVAAMESTKPQAFDVQALGQVIAAAVTHGVRMIPPPVVSMPAARDWKSLDVTVKRTPYGVLEGLTIKRIEERAAA